VTHRRALRATAFGSAVVVATALIIILVLVITFVRRPLPERNGNVELPGLNGKVTVLRDDRAVPQIYADDAADLFRVQGYVNAEDRFFEMDLRRHITSGRLSELVGKKADALHSDALVRTLGWRQVAQQELDQATVSTRRYLEAYAVGVNDYLRGRSASELSISYTLLGRSNSLKPIEPWTPVDSLAWLKAMAWDLRSNYDEELQRARAITTVRPVARVEQLYPDFPYDDRKPIIPGTDGASSASLIPTSLAAKTAKSASAGGTGTAGTTRSAKAGKGALGSVLGSDAAQEALVAADKAVSAIPRVLGGGEGIGSNSWVVGGDLTASGLPLLANDPHLKVSMPGVWTQVGLHCNAVSPSCPFDVTGFGFAGMPGVVIGHNARISWGLSNMKPDVTDFYLERINGDQVEKDGQSTRVRTRTETITVAGDKPVSLVVRSTSHGPVISDVLKDVAVAGGTAPVPEEELSRDTNYAVSLAWTALRPGHSMDALLELNIAGNFEEFRAAALRLDAPAQNLIYADIDGNIGYQAPGKIPIRGPGRDDAQVSSDGSWPHPGWDSAYDWAGFVPVGKLPWVKNPAEGFIVAANQAVTGPDGPVAITRDWDYGYRSERIRDLLLKAKSGQHLLTVNDMRSIQRDTHSGIAEMLVPLLLQTGIQDKDDKTPLSVDEKFTEDAVALLKGWDYNQSTNSAAAAYFNVVWARILELTFADELPDGFKPDGGDRWFEVVRTLLQKKKDLWWDDRVTSDVVESRDEVLRRSMISARLDLTTKLGKDPKRWEWGRLHRVTLEQTPLGERGDNRLMRRLFDRGPYAAPGGSSIVNAFSWDAATGTFGVTTAPSMRMIVDLSNLDQSRWVNQTGTSGHPGDSHYDDQIDTWLKGDDYVWPFGAKAVREAKDEEQNFTAAPG
jgi:penicillin G amidase